jgi:alpha-tubulin suppressor-like RCC1 family protein
LARFIVLSLLFLISALAGGAWQGVGYSVGSASTVTTSAATAISAGGDTCLLTPAGGIECAGLNSDGQLGDGTTTARTVPVPVVGLTSGVAAIAVGADHACALTTGGGVKCWGNDTWGAVGNSNVGPDTCPGQGAPDPCSTEPVDVAGLASSVKAITAGDEHACALTQAGGVKCWGLNDTGQLGDGTSSGPDSCNGSDACSTTPVDVIGLSTGVKQISASHDDTCALTGAGVVKCWGWNGEGQLGIGSAAGPESCGLACSTTPVTVKGLTSDVKQISTGDGTACALTNAGSLKCWGDNHWGQLGDGTSSGPQDCSGEACSTMPVDVTGLAPDVAAVSAGGDDTCVVTNTGSARCWGLNAEGELGDGVTGPEVCGVGHDPCNTTPVDVTGLSSAVSEISVGAGHSCVRTNRGEVKCWGINYDGELGNNGVSDHDCGCSKLPVDVQGFPGAVLGDPECNGQINGADALSDLDQVAGVTGLARCLGSGDVNCDGAITLADVTLELKASAGLIASPLTCPTT